LYLEVKKSQGGSGVEETLIDRRHALNKLSGAAITLMAGFAACIGIGFLYPVPRRRPPALFICLESEVPRDRPLEIKDPQGRKVLLIRKAEGTLMAVATVCTHLGCAVYYRPKTEIFECPCHQGAFDREGNPLYGPPDRPLDSYPTEVREGKVFVQFA